MQAQVVMEFFTIQGEGRRPVERLDLFGGERVIEDWPATADREHQERVMDKRGGKLHAIEYNQWLRFYSPLSERGSV